MKILFCNITYLNKYIGITDDDTPNKGGSWVEENKDAHEQWNFLNYNGCCYGFVMNKGEQFAIERIDKDAVRSDSVDDVTVVWCALNDDNETVIVGWYENATVYRHFRESVVTPIYGIDRVYFTKAKAEDCYLLPESSRTFIVGRASKDGTGRGFGQQNFWYAESAYAREELIPQVLEFFETHKSERINHTSKDFEVPANVLSPITEAESEKAYSDFENKNFHRFLPYGYKLFYSSKSADDAYNVAEALAALHQYDSAVKWYKKVIEIEGESWGTNSHFPYLYQQCEEYEKSTESALDLLKYDEAADINVKHEIYSAIADNYYFRGKNKEGIEWLDKIISESTDEDLLEHTKSVKENWSEYANN